VPEDVGHYHVNWLDVPQAEQNRCQAGQAPCIRMRCDPAMAEEDPQNVERRRARLVCGDVGLKLGHGPNVVHNVSDNDHVGALSAVESHFLVFVFFIVSKERVARNYSDVKEKNTWLFPIKFSLWTYGA
jgi:hypothetical protein